MPFVQYITGGTLGPGANFGDDIYFENCTILASCKFGERCFFINCKFQKCCPKAYSNPNSELKKGCFLKGTTLEYVTIPSGCVLYNCQNTGNRVQQQGTENPSNKTFGKEGNQSLPVNKFNNFDSTKFLDEDGPSEISWDNVNGYSTTDSSIERSWK